MVVHGQLHAPVTLPARENIRHLMTTRLHVPQNPPGHYREVKNPLPLNRDKTTISQLTSYNFLMEYMY